MLMFPGVRTSDSVMCVYLFRNDDPVNFGSFGRAFISMFRVTGVCARVIIGACASMRESDFVCHVTSLDAGSVTHRWLSHVM